MRYLLDTHILLWWLADDPALPTEVRAVITEGTTDILVSAISMAEIAIKSSLGKLSVPDDVAGASMRAGFEELPFTAAHAAELARLPWHHRDPFDRMLVAQARVERSSMISVDGRFGDYDVRLLPTRTTG